MPVWARRLDAVPNQAIGHISEQPVREAERESPFETVTLIQVRNQRKILSRSPSGLRLPDRTSLFRAIGQMAANEMGALGLRSEVSRAGIIGWSVCSRAMSADMMVGLHEILDDHLPVEWAFPRARGRPRPNPARTTSSRCVRSPPIASAGARRRGGAVEIDKDESLPDLLSENSSRKPHSARCEIRGFVHLRGRP